ncbi:MAG: hypothetical protein AAGC81_06945 [Pseudomonadota bacterium]
MRNTITSLACLSLFLAAPATAGNLSKTFNDVAPPPPPKQITSDFNTARGSKFEFDNPQNNLNLGPGGSNGTPSVAQRLDPPFTTVGKVGSGVSN